MTDPRTRIITAAVLGLVVGAAGGWVLGRASVPPLPPPRTFVNPLEKVARGESLVMRRADGTRDRYLVRSVAPDSVLLSVETLPADGPPITREMRVARSYYGFLVILEGDVDPASAEATVRDFVLTSVEPDLLDVPALGRTVPCWKVQGNHRVQAQMTFWFSDELPVHGLLRTDTVKGTIWEIESYGEGGG